MSYRSQNHPPLLRRLNGQDRSSSPLPPERMLASERDILAPPLSSDEERGSPSPPPAPLPPPVQQTKRREPVYPVRQQRFTPVEKGSQAKSGKQDAVEDAPSKKGSQGSVGKRSGGNTMEQGQGLLNDFGEMEDVPRKKRPKTSGRHSFHNIHASKLQEPTSRATGKTSINSSWKAPDESPGSSQESKRPAFRMPATVPYNVGVNSKKPEFKVTPKMATPPRTTAPKFKPAPDPVPHAISNLSNLSATSKFIVPETVDSLLKDIESTTTTTTTFQKPSNLSDSSSPLSSPDSSIIAMSSQAQSSQIESSRLKPGFIHDHSTIRELTPEPDSICPMCRKPVDEKHLYDFSAKHDFKLNVRLQEAFCKEHKQKSASNVYSARGYPKIVWDELEDQMEQHTPRLEAVLEGKVPSVYRDKLEQNVKTGSNRNLLSAMMSEEFRESTTGYYGARGARVMMEYITKSFAAQIRRLAPTDKLIASGGMSKFVQSVLLPELVVRLVMEDMRVDEERAREIIKESGDIGDLLHEEADDAVRRDKDGNEYIYTADISDTDDD